VGIEREARSPFGCTLGLWAGFFGPRGCGFFSAGVAMSVHRFGGDLELVDLTQLYAWAQGRSLAPAQGSEDRHGDGDTSDSTSEEDQ